MGADAAGNIYVAGDATGTTWLLRKSTNGGNSFSTVDSVASGKAFGFAASSTGDLYVIGSIGGMGTLRKSPGGTGAWTNVDQMTPFRPYAIAANGSGNVFVTGQSGSGLIVKKY